MGSVSTKRAGSVYANPAHPYWQAPRDRWLVADMQDVWPYPCRCDVRRACNATRCPCWGRVDHLEQMPSTCCARRAAETANRHGTKPDQRA